MNDRSIRRILLIRRKALGDALVTMPAVLEVARAWPEATIDLVIDRPFAPLFEGLHANVRILSWPSSSGGSWLGVLRGRRYDLVVDWLGSPRTALWTALSGASIRVGYDLPRRRYAYNIRVPRNRDGQHDLRGFAGEAFLDPLRRLGLAPAPWRSGFAAEGLMTGESLALGHVYSDWADTFFTGQGKVVALMFSATWAAKAWPAAEAIRLTGLLRGEGLLPLVVPGPGDEEFVSAMTEGAPDITVAPPTNLPELADLLNRTPLFVGTDCGARHLAAALGLSTVTLFGPTDPGGWNPPGPRHVAVRTGESCSPCDLTTCPVAGHPCMEGLTADMVMEGIGRIPGLAT
jgi:ADP-heptose:LPS heptosyltransferase